MKRNAYVTIPAVAAMVIALVSCKPAKKDAAQAPDAEQAAVVKTYKVVRQRISEKISYTGTLEAARKTSITPEVGGKIARILVHEGDSVRAGQVLAELETESTRLQLRQAEAGVAVAEAGYNDALKNKERMDRLIKENAVSEQQAEKVTLAFDAAKAQREQAQAALNLAKYALNISIMKAPFSGVIAAKNAEVGDVINPMMGGFSGRLRSPDAHRLRQGQDRHRHPRERRAPPPEGPAGPPPHAGLPRPGIPGRGDHRQLDGGRGHQEVPRRGPVRQRRRRAPARDVRRGRFRVQHA